MHTDQHKLWFNYLCNLFYGDCCF